MTAWRWTTAEGLLIDLDEVCHRPWCKRSRDFDGKCARYLSTGQPIDAGVGWCLRCRPRWQLAAAEEHAPPAGQPGAHGRDEALGMSGGGGEVGGVLHSGSIGMAIWIDGAPVGSSTMFSRVAATSLSLVTTIAGVEQPELEVHSVYAGAPGVATCSVHISSWPSKTRSHVAEHADSEPEACWVLCRPRACVYDHAHRVLDALKDPGGHVTCDLDDEAFSVLEHV